MWCSFLLTLSVACMGAIWATPLLSDFSTLQERVSARIPCNGAEALNRAYAKYGVEAPASLTGIDSIIAIARATSHIARATVLFTTNISPRCTVVHHPRSSWVRVLQTCTWKGVIRTA